MRCKTAGVATSTALLAHVATKLQQAGLADLADLVRLWTNLPQEVQDRVVDLVWQAVVAKARG